MVCFALCRLDKLEVCARPDTFASVVGKLQLGQAQRDNMLAVRKQWRDYLARYPLP